MGMSAQFQGLTAARKKLAQLSKGLRQVASGEVVAEVAAEASIFLGEVGDAKLSKHMLTGAARASLDVHADGSLVLLSANRYLRYHGWWPFRRGMPGFVVKRVAQMFARRVLAALGGRTGDLGVLAGGLADEADAADAKAAGKRAEVLRKRAEKEKKLEAEMAAAREKGAKKRAEERARNAARWKKIYGRSRRG